MIAVLGEVMIELQSAAPGLLRQGVAGDTFNTSVALAKLGHPVSYFSALGTDEYSQTIIEAMHQYKVQSENILRLPDGKPGLYAIQNDESGERTFVYWRNESAAKACFSNIHLFEKLLEKAADCQAFYWSGITLALMSEPVLAMWKDFLVRQRQRGKPVFFDTNYRPGLWENNENCLGTYKLAISLCDYFFPSEEDLYGILKLNSFNDLSDFLDSLDVKLIVMSSHREAHFWQPDARGALTLEYSKVMVDATGAGDAFSGALMSGVINRQPILEVIKNAHLCASKVTEFKGAILPDDQWKRISATLSNR